MKLFYSVNSPYARKARIVVMEKGIADIELIAVNPLESPAELLTVNPLSKIPALILDNGSSLCDSPVICEYLDSLSAKQPLFPQGREKWEVLGRAALADGILDAAVGLVLEGRRPEELRSALWIERHTAAIKRTLAILAQKVDALEEFNIATITMGCVLGYLNFRHPHIEWQKDHPALAEWFAQFSERPSMKETMPGV